MNALSIMKACLKFCHVVRNVIADKMLSKSATLLPRSPLEHAVRADFTYSQSGDLVKRELSHSRPILITKA